MPYIKEEQRKGLRELVEAIESELNARLLAGTLDQKGLAGNLCYVTFKLIRHFYADGRWYDQADAEKVCKRAWHEFERRFLDPYEDEAIERNGDVF